MPAQPEIVAEILDLCRRAAEANRACPARDGNVVHLTPELADDVMIVADLHGNRLNFDKLLRVAGLEKHPRRHLIMQEVCHGGPEYPGGDGGCMSHLMLEDCIRLKTQFPDRFHFLLSNHELAELAEYPISKSRRMLNVLFRCGINEMYGPAGEQVRSAYMDFLGTCPLAVRVGRGLFITHSLPDHCDRDRFDCSVFQRPLTGADWKSGSPAFRLVWGRDFRTANAEAFARQVGADVLIHGHEPCEAGFSAPNPRQVILDGCCKNAAYVILPVGPKLTQKDVIARITGLHSDQAARNCRKQP